MVTTSLSSSCDSLSSIVGSVAAQIQQLTSCVDSLTQISISCTYCSESAHSHLWSPMSVSASGNNPPKLNTNPFRDYDRSSNVILFGLPESSLLTTKSAIDEVSHHLIGKSIKVKDAFRLGRKPVVAEVNSSGDESDTERPTPCSRPLLIKCENVWDRRFLLASRRNLKSFKYKLFIREDLPPVDRLPNSNSPVNSRTTSH